MPQEKIPKVDFDKIDLIVHLIMYAALAYAICMALFDKIVDRSLNLWWVPISLGIFGLGIEVLQVMLPINRFFSWEDAASNFIGACSFFAWIHFIRK
jgi:VanZ family protein